MTPRASITPFAAFVVFILVMAGLQAKSESIRFVLGVWLDTPAFWVVVVLGVVGGWLGRAGRSA